MSRLKDNNSYTLDMTEGPIWRSLIVFSIPLIMGDILQQFYSLADSIIVGRFVSKQALAAVTGTDTTVNIIIGIFTGLSVGATVILAQLFGAKEEKDLHEAVQTTIVMTLTGGVSFSIIGVLLTPALLRMLATPEDVYKDANTYLIIYFGGLLGLVLYNMCSSIFRAVGNTRLPLIALIITSVSNIALDLIFVLVFRWGITGAAVATVAAQFASGVYLLGKLCTTGEMFRVDLKHLVFRKEWCLRILGVGIPFSFQRSIVAVSNTLIISRINTFGSSAMAAWGVYRKIDKLLMNVSQNLSAAVSTYVGQNYGAGKTGRIRGGSNAGYMINSVFTVIFIIVIVLFRTPIIALFNTDAEVIRYGGIMMMYLMPFQILSANNQIQAGILRGYGDSMGPMVITLFSHVVIRQIYLAIAWGLDPRLETAMNCYPIGWAVCVICMYIYSVRKKQRRHR